MQAWLQGFSRSYAILPPFTYIVRILMSRKAWRRILILLVLLAVIAGLAGWRLSGRAAEAAAKAAVRSMVRIGIRCCEAPPREQLVGATDEPLPRAYSV